MALKWYKSTSGPDGRSEYRADVGPIRLAVWPSSRGGYAAAIETVDGALSISTTDPLVTYRSRKSAQLFACMLLQQLRDRIDAALDEKVGEG